MPYAYDTVAGEPGVTLSGRESVSLLVARTLLKNAPTLIIDEPTSSLDAATESSVMEALERLMVEERTTLIIAHRGPDRSRATRII